jgi:hypothetical protein
MIELDRRSLMLGIGALVTALALPGRLAASGMRPALFVTDSRIAAGADAAQVWRAAGVRVIDRVHEDLGQAWHSLIPNLLEQRNGPIAGLTLWVDSYICETFGREHGLGMQRAPVPAGGLLHGWMLAPTGA